MSLGAAILIVGLLGLPVWSPGLRIAVLIVGVVVGSFFAYDFYRWEYAKCHQWDNLPELPGHYAPPESDVCRAIRWAR
jgi:hypothetical protein